MAFVMAPPSLGGFSLRVQLFAQTANALEDKPVRAFRVVTSPEVTIREFCEEASRIHKMNYGRPIAILKCQDDQEFDVTQDDIVGHLFANLSIIRITHSIPGVRDSMPVDSALRYDPGPNISRKRDREGSARPNGTSPSNAWIANKRQRVSEIDPDQPIPSRETGLEIDGPMQVENREALISNPRGSNTPGRAIRNSQDVRQNVPTIPETPPPEPPPHREQVLADKQSLKPKVHGQSPFLSQTAKASPFGDGPARNQASAVRAKSASYHIQRSTERGRSVSTAATSPEELDAQSIQGLRGSAKSIGSEPGYASSLQVNGKPASRSPNEQSIYENIESHSEGAASILSKTKASLKIKKSSPYESLSQEQSSHFNTPPTGGRRNSRPREQRTPSQLSLTPNSRERENERLNQQADEAKKSRMVAEAMEQCTREAEEARAAEEARLQKEARLRKETEDREEKARRDAIVATATRLERERVERVLEAKRLENERVERVKAAKSREDERVAEEKRQEEREVAEHGEREESLAEETKRSREEVERKKAAAAEELRKTQEQENAEAIKQKSLSPAAPLRNTSNASTPGGSQLPPTQLRQTPIRPPQRPQISQSSTPFIPSGRKSALKSSVSSLSGSSPLLIRNSRSRSYGSDISVNPLDSVHMKQRRVTFAVEAPVVIEAATAQLVRKQTPILPPAFKLSSNPTSKAAPILPGQRASLSGISTPKTVAVPRKATPRTATPPVLPKPLSTEKRITTPILPPSRRAFDAVIPTTNNTPSATKLTTLATKASASAKKIMPPVTKIKRPPMTKVVPPVTKVTHPVTTNGFKSVGILLPSVGDEKQHVKHFKKVPVQEAQAKWEALQPMIRTSTGQMSSQTSTTHDVELRSQSRGPKEKSKSVEPKRPVKPDGDKVSNAAKKSYVVNSQHLMSPSDDGDAQGDRDVEMASTHSSSHDSRSPVIFSQHTDTDVPALPSLSQTIIIIDDDETQSGSESPLGNPEAEDKESSSDSTSDSSCDESDGESEMGEADENTVVQVPQSSPDLPRKTGSASVLKPESLAGQNKLPSSTGSAESRLMVRSSVATPKQQIKGGASLSAMNATKPSLVSYVSTRQVDKAKLVQPQTHESGGSESDSDSTTDSSDDDDAQSAAQGISQQSEARKARSDSASTSGSDTEEDQTAKIRNELAAEIARVAGEDSQFGSGKKETTLRVMKQAGKELKKKKPDKYVQGYRFSQVL